MKKLLLTIGTVAAIAAPVASVVACGKPSEIKTNFGDKYHVIPKLGDDPADKENAAFAPDGFKWPSGVTTIEEFAFDNNNLWENFKIPNTVTHIEECAFSDAILPQGFQLPKAIKKIDHNAFLDCLFPKGFFIPNNDIEFQSWAFGEATFAPDFKIPYDLYQKISKLPKDNDNPFADAKIITAYEPDGKTIKSTETYLDSHAFKSSGTNS